MEKIISINHQYNTLETLQEFFIKSSSFVCAKEYDVWDHRVNAKGQMEQCLILKKNSLNAIKICHN